MPKTQYTMCDRCESTFPGAEVPPHTFNGRTCEVDRMTINDRGEPYTRVVFRKWPAIHGGEVIALMPDLFEGRLVTSYMHIGQHSGADYAHVIDVTMPATEEDYAPLLAELTRIGYRVKVVSRR